MKRIFHIEIQNKSHQLLLNDVATVRRFIQLLSEGLVLPRDYIELTNITLPGNLTPSQCTLRQLGLAPDFIVKIRDTRNLWGIPPITTFKPPRVGKKLAVIDLDKTICDPRAPTLAMGFERPGLQQFITDISDLYDIGFWSATSMQVLTSKLTDLKLYHHLQHPVLFYADKTAMTMTVIGNKTAFIKPLQVIWDEYPMYDATNTVICDDNMDTFHNNKANGILVRPYMSRTRVTDTELSKLGAYLIRIANKDFTTLNHSNWRRN